MNQEKTCRTCKFWEPDFADSPGESSYMPYGTVGFCKRNKFFRASEPLWDKSFDISVIKAYVVDAEDYFVELRTYPDFGCNQYEPKDIP